jgi:iron complex outermembrane receptor protein
VGFRTIAGVPFTRLITLNGNEKIKSEDVLSYEVGYRTKPTDKFSLDVAAFHSVYNNLRTAEMGTPVVHMTPVPHVEVPLVWGNKQDAKSFGLEIAANWQPKENWRLALAYTYLDVSTTLEPDSTATLVPEGYNRNTPPNQINLRSFLDLPGNREFDASLYYVQGFKHHDVPGYVRLDLRYGWTLRDGSQLSIVGQNLLQDHHPEFYEVLSEVPTEVPRSVYLSLSKSW